MGVFNFLANFFEDFKISEKFKTLERTLTESEIISFGSMYDTQTFHTDVELAKSSVFKGLVASGFHTLVIAWTLFFNLGLLEGTSMGSPGLNYVKWFRPVRPGDSLRVETEVVSKRETSKSDRGIVILRHRANNQNGETVLEYESVGFVLRRQ
jgi:acyl dehydratase